MEEDLDPLTVEETPRPTGEIVEQAELQRSPDFAPAPTNVPVGDFARGSTPPREPSAQDSPNLAPVPAYQPAPETPPPSFQSAYEPQTQPPSAVQEIADNPEEYTPQQAPEPDIWRHRYVDPQVDAAAQAHDKQRALEMQRTAQQSEDRRAKGVLKGLRDSGVEIETDPTTGEQRPKRDEQGRVLYRPAVISPLEEREGGKFVMIKRNRFGKDVEIPVIPKTDPSTGERYVLDEDGVSRHPAGIDAQFLKHQELQNSGKVLALHRQQYAALGQQRKALDDQLKALNTESANLGLTDSPTPEQRVRLDGIQKDRQRIAQQMRALDAQRAGLAANLTAAQSDYLQKKSSLIESSKQEVAAKSPGAAISMAAGNAPLSVSVPHSGQPLGLNEFMATPVFKAMDVPKKIEALKSWVDAQATWQKANIPGFNEEEFRGRYPDRSGFFGGLHDLGEGAWNALVDAGPEWLARVIRGKQGGITLAGNTWADRYIAEQQADERAKATSLQSLAKAPVALGIDRSDLVSGPSSLLSSTAVGLAASAAGAAAGGSIGGPVGAGIGAIVAPLAGAPAWYWAAKDSFIEQVRDAVVAKNPNITEAQWEAARDSIESQAQDYGLWEAGPEAASQMLTAGLFKGAGKLIGNLLGRGAVEGLAKKAAASLAAKMGGEVAEELATETITQHGQGKIEADVGLSDKAPTWREAFDQVYGQTVVGTLLQGGAHLAYEHIHEAREMSHLVREQKTENTAFATEWNQKNPEVQIKPEDAPHVRAAVAAGIDENDDAELGARVEAIQQLAVQHVDAERTGDTAAAAELEQQLAGVQGEHEEFAVRAAQRTQQVEAAIKEITSEPDPKTKIALAGALNAEHGNPMRGAERQALMSKRDKAGKPYAEAYTGTDGKRAVRLTEDGRAAIAASHPAVAKLLTAKPISSRRAKPSVGPVAPPVPASESTKTAGTIPATTPTASVAPSPAASAPERTGAAPGTATTEATSTPKKKWMVDILGQTPRGGITAPVEVEAETEQAAKDKAIAKFPGVKVFRISAKEINDTDRRTAATPAPRNDSNPPPIADTPASTAESHAAPAAQSAEPAKAQTLHDLDGEPVEWGETRGTLHIDDDGVAVIRPLSAKLPDVIVSNRADVAADSIEGLRVVSVDAGNAELPTKPRATLNSRDASGEWTLGGRAGYRFLNSFFDDDGQFAGVLVRHGDEDAQIVRGDLAFQIALEEASASKRLRTEVPRKILAEIQAREPAAVPVTPNDPERTQQRAENNRKRIIVTLGPVLDVLDALHRVNAGMVTEAEAARGSGARILPAAVNSALARVEAAFSALDASDPQNENLMSTLLDMHSELTDEKSKITSVQRGGGLGENTPQPANQSAPEARNAAARGTASNRPEITTPIAPASNGEPTLRSTMNRLLNGEGLRATLEKMGWGFKSVSGDERGLGATFAGGNLALTFDESALEGRLSRKTDPESFLRAAIDEEVTHLATLEFVRREWQANGRKSPDGRPESFESAWQREGSHVARELESAKLPDGRTYASFVRETYGDLDLEGANLAAEFVRQLSQMERGQIPTEGYLRRFVEKILAVLSEVLGSRAKWGEGLRRFYENTQSVFEEATAKASSPTASTKNESSPTEDAPKPPKPPKRASTQVTLSKVDADKILKVTKAIPEADIYSETDEKGKEDFGRETEPHITALFGLDSTVTAADVEKVMQKLGMTEIKAKLGKLSLFENSDRPYDVLKVSVNSPDLHRVNAALKGLPYTSDYPDYTPHLTIAYLKKGEGAKYRGGTQFEGMKLSFPSLTFSDSQRQKSEISLTAKPASTAEKQPPKTSEKSQKSAAPTKSYPTVNEALNRASSLASAVTVPRGATHIKARDTRGREAIAEISGPNILQGAGPWKASVSGRLQSGKFVPMGPVSLKETTKLSTPPESNEVEAHQSLSDAFASALRAMPEKVQQVLSLASHNKSFPEIATATGLSEEGARQAYGQGMARLKLVREKMTATPSVFQQAEAEKVGSRTIGRPELANPVTDERSRRFVDAVDEQRKDLQLPNTKADYETDAQAEAAWKTLGEQGVRESLLSAARTGRQLSDAETLNAKRLVASASLAAIRNNDTEKMLEAALLLDAYRETGTEQARAFRMRRDAVRTPSQRLGEYLGEAMLTPTRKRRKALDRSKVDGDTALREKILRDQVEKVEKIKERLRQLGIDLDTLDDKGLRDLANNPAQAARAVNAIRTAKGDFWDQLYEYWVSSILSAPTTNIANIVGNLGNGIWDMLPQRFVEAFVNLFVRDPKSAQFGEFKHMLRGVVPGMTRASRNMVMSWRTEQPVFEGDVSGTPGSSKLDHGFQHAIPGRAGRIIRTPLRMLGAADDYAKSLFATMHVGAVAYRIAKEEGLTGEAMALRIAQLSKTPTEMISEYRYRVTDDASVAARAQVIAGTDLTRIQDKSSEEWEMARNEAALKMAEDAGYTTDAWEEAISKAKELAFQEELGPIGKAIIGLKKKYRPLAYVIPFVATPLNIVRLLWHKSPLASIPLVYRLFRQGLVEMGWTGGDWRYTKTMAVRDVAEQIIAWGLMLSIWSLATPGGGDDDRPYITGSMPYKPGEKGERDIAARTAPNQSIRVGNQWYSYARIEPFATILSATVDLIDRTDKLQRGEDPTAAAGKAFRQIMSQMTDKTFTRGISDLLAAVQDGDSFVKWMGDFGTSWVPNLIRASARESDNYAREQAVWGDHVEWRDMFLKRLEYKSLPVGGDSPQPKVDLWGRDIVKETNPKPATDWLFRMLSPVKSQSASIHNLDRLIVNFNNTHPNETFAPIPPQKYWMIGSDTYDPVTKKTLRKGSQVFMTEKEYHDFLKLSGRMAATQLQSQQFNFNQPTPEDIETMKKQIISARREARKIIWLRRAERH